MRRVGEPAPVAFGCTAPMMSRQPKVGVDWLTLMPSPDWWGMTNPEPVTSATDDQPVASDPVALMYSAPLVMSRHSDPARAVTLPSGAPLDTSNDATAAPLPSTSVSPRLPMRNWPSRWISSRTSIMSARLPVGLPVKHLAAVGIAGDSPHAAAPASAGSDLRLRSRCLRSRCLRSGHRALLQHLLRRAARRRIDLGRRHSAARADQAEDAVGHRIGHGALRCHCRSRARPLRVVRPARAAQVRDLPLQLLVLAVVAHGHSAGDRVDLTLHGLRATAAKEASRVERRTQAVLRQRAEVLRTLAEEASGIHRAIDGVPHLLEVLPRRRDHVADTDLGAGGVRHRADRLLLRVARSHAVLRAQRIDRRFLFRTQCPDYPPACPLFANLSWTRPPIICCRSSSFGTTRARSRPRLFATDRSTFARPRMPMMLRSIGLPVSCRNSSCRMRSCSRFWA